mgnify:FL=1
MEPVIGQWDRHRVIASKPTAATGEPVIVWDTETWGLDATALAFACTNVVSTGDEQVFYDRETLRTYLESMAPCVAYAHNGNRYDVFSLFTAVNNENTS